MIYFLFLYSRTKFTIGVTPTLVYAEQFSLDTGDSEMRQNRHIQA